MKVLLLGDTHGNMNWFMRACQKAAELGCTIILQLGDFGFWEHHPSGAEFLKACAQSLEGYDLSCIWIDGNHENHTLLRSRYGPGGQQHDPHETFGFWKIRERLWYAPRGCRWEWDGIKFLALGGAYSIDAEYRTPGSSWWPEELITDEEVDRCIDGGLADVMVCHDAPTMAAGVIPYNGSWDRQKDNWPASVHNRLLIQEVVDAVRPKLLVHGHYHHRNSTVISPDGPRVEGLHRDGESTSMAVLTLPDLTVSYK